MDNDNSNNNNEMNNNKFDLNNNLNQEFNNQDQGFSNQNQGFNNWNQGFSNQNQGFNNSNQGFSNQNQGFSNSNQGFCNQNQGFNSQMSNEFNNNYNGGFRLTDRDISILRHDAEMPLYRVLQVVNVLFIIGVIIVFIVSFRNNMNDISNVFNSTIEATESGKQIDAQQLEQQIPANVQLFVTIIFVIPYLLFVLAYAYAQVRSRSVKITERQFPEIYEMINRYAQIYNMPVPEAYVVQENGILNAFSSFVVRKKYIQINADLFEVAYREYNDLGSIGFVVAHEMAHIKLGHASLFYQLSILWGNIIPFLGQAASRTREYSCDRLAQVVSGNDGIEALMALTVGKHLYKRINVQDYIHESIKINGFFVGLYNLLATHPILPKRLKALVIKNRSGELF